MSLRSKPATGATHGDSARLAKPAAKRPSTLGWLHRAHTPTLIQMESVECGAAALGIILSYYGRRVELEELRVLCGVNRDGAKAASIIRAGKQFGLMGKGYQMDIKKLMSAPMPVIAFWAFQHFLVIEGFGRRFGKTVVYVNDPATGPRTMDYEEFDDAFTGIVLTFEPTDQFTKGGRKQSFWSNLRSRWVPSQGLAALLLMVSFLLVIPGIVTPGLTRVYIDQASSGQLAGSLRWIVLGTLATALLTFVLTAVQQNSIRLLFGRISLETVPQFFHHLLRLPIDFFLQRQPAELTRRIRGNNQVNEILARDMATTLVNLVLIVFYAAALFRYDALLSVIGIGISALNLFLLRMLSRIRTDGVSRLRVSRGKLTATTINAISMIETVKASGQESDAFRRWAGHQAKVSTLEQKLGVPTAVLTAVPPALNVLNAALLLWVGGDRVMAGTIGVGLLVAFQGLLSAFTRPIVQLSNLGERIQDISAEVDRIRDVLGAPVDPIMERRDPEVTELMSGRITVDSLTFGYGPLSAPVIEDVSFSVRPGRRTAIVGASGSGKSTIGKLLAGMYEPRSGEIVFDNRQRGEWSRWQLASSVVFVEQDITILEGTIRENITLWDSTISEERIVAALRDAELYDIVAKRSGGLDSLLTEQGNNFSGGQRQRLAIARALASNPSVLVLDEATSALDAETERKIEENLRQRGCGVLTIAHRISTVRDADEIIVLSQGRVIERGEHSELLAQSGAYYRLVSST